MATVLRDGAWTRRLRSHKDSYLKKSGSQRRKPVLTKSPKLSVLKRQISVSEPDEWNDNTSSDDEQLTSSQARRTEIPFWERRELASTTPPVAQLRTVPSVPSLAVNPAANIAATNFSVPVDFVPPHLRGPIATHATTASLAKSTPNLSQSARTTAYAKPLAVVPRSSQPSRTSPISRPLAVIPKVNQPSRTTAASGPSRARQVLVPVKRPTATEKVEPVSAVVLEEQKRRDRTAGEESVEVYCNANSDWGRVVVKFDTRSHWKEMKRIMVVYYDRQLTPDENDFVRKYKMWDEENNDFHHCYLYTRYASSASSEAE